MKRREPEGRGLWFIVCQKAGKTLIPNGKEYRPVSLQKTVSELSGYKNPGTQGQIPGLLSG